MTIEQLIERSHAAAVKRGRWNDGGHVFASVKAGVTVAALMKIKVEKRKPTKLKGTP